VPQCQQAEAYIDEIDKTDAKLALAPVAGGLHLTAEIDDLKIRGHVSYAVACLSGSNQFAISANAASIDGILARSSNGTNGLAANLVVSDIQVPGFAINVTGIPSAVLKILPLGNMIQLVGPTVTGLFVNQLLNKVVGALGPQKIHPSVRPSTCRSRRARSTSLQVAVR
jgi:hypothetical protein